MSLDRLIYSFVQMYNVYQAWQAAKDKGKMMYVQRGAWPADAMPTDISTIHSTIENACPAGGTGAHPYDAID